jgi:outer membrane protein OmpA-like peptidoglycan-associated protein
MRRRSLFLATAVAAALGVPLVACQAPQKADTPVRVVFFEEDSAALNASGEAVLREVAEMAKARPSAPVVVAGYAGPAGGRAYNRALSEARARHVADHLVEDGVAQSRIVVRPRGETPFEMMPTESRRVEITIGG